ASISPTKGDVIIRKNRIGAFYGSNLHRILKRRGIDTVIVSGVSTSVGCDTTARDATNRDYKTIFVSDGCLSRPLADQGWGNITGEDVARVHLSSLAKAFAMVVTTQQVADLIRRS
ncbi:MAG: isochorismatase family cysteine hydrolase, partial [Dehalococcoidia bacterium]|nr:isochorismatase family cysteine hydrolase [Dehalococcoidia bacterium]